MKTPTPLIAFHGDQRIKDKYLARIRAHAAADEIVAGQYWERGKGCAVGCTIHGDDHASYETKLGIPEILARLEDRLFEGLFAFAPVAAKGWPERFIQAAQPGADLSMVWPKFAHWLLMDEEHGVVRFDKNPRTRLVIEAVGTLFARWVAGDEPTGEEWTCASTASYSHCTAAAFASDLPYSSVTAAAADAAAATAAAGSDYASSFTARGRNYILMADKLIALMAEAKP